jgi:hypothetical protein
MAEKRGVTQRSAANTSAGAVSAAQRIAPAVNVAAFNSCGDTRARVSAAVSR